MEKPDRGKLLCSLCLYGAQLYVRVIVSVYIVIVNLRSRDFLPVFMSKRVNVSNVTCPLIDRSASSPANLTTLRNKRVKMRSIAVFMRGKAILYLYERYSSVNI